MIRSMTGFGRSERCEDGRKFIVEMKSVNNRYLDLSIRLPRQFNSFEAAIRNLLRQYIQRGKVDVFISFEELENSNVTVHYNKSLAEQYYRYVNEMAEQFHLNNDLSVADLSRYPDVLTCEETDEDAGQLWEPLRATVEEAAANFCNARIREGEFLKKDLLDKLDNLSGDVAFISSRAPAIVEEYQKQLQSRVEELLSGAQVDENRIVQETAIYSDKVCIDEELTRLRSHIEAVRQTLNADESVGRKLDFLAQEMNREANTILSKTPDAESADHAIELKTGIEKVREQIQNIE